MNAHETAPIHESYLPFSRAQLLTHFAPVSGNPTELQRHLTYYRESAGRAQAYEAAALTGTVTTSKQAQKARQIEKDERFWIVSALLAAYYSDDRAAALTRILTAALGEHPPFQGCSSWSQALGQDPRLYFEANLPSPPSYRKWLAERRSDRILIPHVLESALGKTVLEGPTKADAMLIAPDTGFAVLFEAKVLSDVSKDTNHDVARNQIARNIDVLLDRNPRLRGGLELRDPDRSCFVLITPQLFKDHPETRLYGWLINAYKQNAELLANHLPHRNREKDLDAVPHRLGWLTWQELDQVNPGSCPWLSTTSATVDQ